MESKINDKTKMKHTTRLLIALTLTLLAGALIGYGVGANDQYDRIKFFLVDQTTTGEPFVIGQESYLIQKVNHSLALEMNNSFQDVIISIPEKDSGK